MIKSTLTHFMTFDDICTITYFRCFIVKLLALSLLVAIAYWLRLTRHLMRKTLSPNASNAVKKGNTLYLQLTLLLENDNYTSIFHTSLRSILNYTFSQTMSYRDVVALTRMTGCKQTYLVAWLLHNDSQLPLYEICASKLSGPFSFELIFHEKFTVSLSRSQRCF